MTVPFYINRVSDLYDLGVTTEVNGRHVMAVPIPYQPTFIERIKAAWWVITGRAHAFVWPKHGELENAIRRSMAVHDMAKW